MAFYDKMSLNAVVNREHLMRSWVGNGAVTTCPWIGPEHYDDYQLLTQLDYKLRVCAEGPHDHRPGHNHKTDHKLCNEKIRTRIRYLGVQLVMDVRVVWSKVMRTVGAGETVEEIVDKLIETANRRPLQRRPSNSVKRTRDTATQENFELRRQLDLAEETSGAVIAELQAEISQLKEKIIERNQRGSSEHSLREEIERLNFQLAVSGTLLPEN